MFSVLKDTPPKLIFDDVKLYDSIELETFTPWFMCQVTEYDEIFKCSFGNMKFISNIEALIDLNTSNKIDEIYLVSPARLNKSETWRSDLLQSVLTTSASNDDDHCRIFKYVLMSGESFIDPPEAQLINESINFEELLDFEHLRKKLALDKE